LVVVVVAVAIAYTSTLLNLIEVDKQRELESGDLNWVDGLINIPARLFVLTWVKEY